MPYIPRGNKCGRMLTIATSVFRLPTDAASVVGFFYSLGVVMLFLGRALRALPVAGMLILAGCGGGASAPAAMLPVQSPGITVGEPTPGSFDTTAHQRLAADAVCAEQSNRLYLIDNKYVFWDRAGNCADNSYGQTLMGADASVDLCSASDSIAGPMVRCTDDSVRPLFDAIRKNLDAADLGLGSAHTVKKLDVPAKAGSALPIETLAKESFSGVTQAKNVVVTSAEAFDQLWREHAGNAIPAPAMPKVDFSTHMVIAIFAGNRNACHEFEISRVSIAAKAGGNGLERQIRVDYLDRDISATTMCVAAITSPMQMIKVPASSMGVVFQRLDAEPVPFTIAYQTGYSLPRGPGTSTLVIRDRSTFEQEFELRRNGDPATPEVNFDKQMVIAVFGTGSDGCQGMGIQSIYRVDGKIVVNVVQSRPAPGSMIMCTQALTFPAQWVVVDKSDAPVEFLMQTRYYSLG